MLFGDNEQQPGGGEGEARPQRSERSFSPRQGGASRFPRESRGFSDRNETPREGVRSDHPLSQQLRRENQESKPSRFPRKRFSR